MEKNNEEQNRNGSYPYDEHARSRGPPRTLYHGTCEQHAHDQMKRYKHYEHGNGRPVCLSEDALQALYYATKRSMQQNQKPLILVIDTRTQARYEPFTPGDTPDTWETTRLRKSAYIEYKPCTDSEGKITIEEAEKIKQLDPRIPRDRHYH